MFGSIGMTELIVILVVALVVIGPKRLPELARTLGKALGDFKRATSDFQDSFSLEDDYELLDEDAREKEPGEKKSGRKAGEEEDAAEGEAAPDGADGEEAAAADAPESGAEPQEAAREDGAKT